MGDIANKPPLRRLILGGIVFGTGFFSPLLIPLVIASSLSEGIKALLSGLLALGIPELFMIIAAAILGKPGFSYLKQKIYGWFMKFSPPDMVSLTRYRMGLLFFSLPLLSGFFIPYLLNIVPFLKENLLYFLIAGDIMLLFSLLILGGDFWDKLRSLYIHKSKVTIHQYSSSKDNDQRQ
ncbi:MAG: hypothetical protein P8100_07205 [bacterium]